MNRTEHRNPNVADVEDARAMKAQIEQEVREDPPVAPVWTIEEAELVWRILDDHHKNNEGFEDSLNDMEGGSGVHSPLKRIVIDLQKQWTEAKGIEDYARYSDLRVKVEEPVSRKDVLREVYEKVDTGLVRCELERWLREEIGDDS